MNYNNFSCRVVIPRPPSLPRPEAPAKNPAKKIRRVSRQRLAASISAKTIVLGIVSASVCSADAAVLHPAELRIIPATQTMSFRDVVDQPVIVDSHSEVPDAVAFSEQLEALTARMSNLTVESIRAANPTGETDLSPITKLLLCSGLGVAFAQMRLLFRADLRC